MKKRTIVLLGLELATANFGSLLRGSKRVPQPAKSQVVESYGKLPLSFEPNYGQTASDVKFLSRSRAYSLLFKSAEVVLAFGRGQYCGVIRIKLVGANGTPIISGFDELPGKSNYFLGNDTGSWRTGIPTYARVEYKDVYPGVGLVFYGNQRQLEYDFVVAPHADPRSIGLEVEGATRLTVDGKGDVVLTVPAGEVRLHKPRLYEATKGSRRQIAGEYALVGRNRIGFQIGPYDPAKTLVIDPILRYSTYLGGDLGDLGNAIAVDAFGNAYIAGSTGSGNFPAVNPLQSSPVRFGDAFIAKLNPEGTALIYSTFLGGDFLDEATGIAVDAAGSAYVTGYTLSSNFPTLNAFQGPGRGGQSFSDASAFVAKLNPSGNALVYSTYLGGRDQDQGRSIAVDLVGNAYVAGFTESTDFPTLNPLQRQLRGSRDAFVSKLNSAGSALVYSTYLGGSGFDEAHGVAVDASGNAYLTGTTVSPDFPTTAGAFQTASSGSYDAFVAKLNPAGSALVYSTYLGGRDREVGNGIAVDSAGNAHVIGITGSSDFPTANPLQASLRTSNRSAVPGNAFVTKVNTAGSMLLYSTYLGTEADGRSIVLDNLGNALVTGLTGPSGFPIRQFFQSPGSDGSFVSKIDPNGSALVYSVFLGGGRSSGIAVDRAGNAYVTGQILEFSSIPTTAGAYQTIFGGEYDAFVMKIDPANPLPVLVSLSPASAAPGDQDVTLTLSGSSFLPDSVVRWNGSDRPTTLVDSTRLTVALTSADTALPGFGTVTVFNAPPGGGSSNFLTFFIGRPNPLPALSSLSPSVVTAGGLDFTLTVVGSGLVETSVVRWNGRDRSTRFISDNELQAFIPAIDIAVARGISITVFNPRPGGGISNTLGLGMAGTLPPNVQGVSPGGAIVGGGDFTLEVLGYEFAANSVVRWNGNDRPTRFSTRNRLEASIAASDIAALGFAEITVYTPPPGGGLSSVSMFPVYVGLATNDIVYHRNSGKIYASVPGRAGIRGNGVVAIDPTTGEIGPPIFVGNEPSKLAISDDGRFLYVALDGSSSVRRLELVSQTLEPPFALGESRGVSSPLVRDMKVLPGRPGSVAISLLLPNTSPSTGGVAIYDDGVRRPKQTPGHTDSDFIEVSSSASLLYGVSFDGVFYRMSVDTSGVSILDSTKVRSGFGYDMKFDNGRIYTTSGLLFDPETRRVLGRFPMEGTSASFGDSAIAADSAVGRTFILTNLPGGAFVRPLLAFDQRTLSLVGTLGIPGVSASPSSPGALSSLLRWGENGLAFRTTGDQVFVFRAPSLMAPFVPLMINPGGGVNSASFRSATPLVPGSMVSLFGTGLASSTALADSPPLPVTLGGVSVRVNSIPAPLFFVSPHQINFQMPWELSGRTQASIVVVRNDLASTPETISMGPFGPGVFSVGSTSGEQGAIIIASSGELAAPSGSIPGRTSRPAKRGEIVSFFCTGLGTVANPPSSGVVAPDSPLSRTVVNPAVTIGSVPANVTFSGLAPGYVGLYQVNVQLPDNAPAGSGVPVVLKIGGVDSNMVTMAVQ